MFFLCRRHVQGAGARASASTVSTHRFGACPQRFCAGPPRLRASPWWVLWATWAASWDHPMWWGCLSPAGRASASLTPGALSRLRLRDGPLPAGYRGLRCALAPWRSRRSLRARRPHAPHALKIARRAVAIVSASQSALGNQRLQHGDALIRSEPEEPTGLRHRQAQAGHLPVLGHDSLEYRPHRRHGHCSEPSLIRDWPKRHHCDQQRSQQCAGHYRTRQLHE
jgi:hypothetical protein